MSKIEIVQNLLKENLDAVIGDPLENYCATRCPVYEFPGTSILTIEYSVAPKIGLYTVEELQKFMEDLVPGVVPDREYEVYHNSRDKMLNFGFRYYVERIGEITERKTKTITCEDSRLVELSNLCEENKNEETPLYKTLAIYLYPNEAIAREPNTEMHGKLGERRLWISLKELKKHQKKSKKLGRVLISNMYGE